MNILLLTTLVLLSEGLPDHETIFILRPAMDPQGIVDDRWSEAIRFRNEDSTIANLRATPVVWTAEEKNWADQIATRLPEWSSWVDSLMIPFGQVSLPPRVTILLGNRGGSDAFTFGDSTICFDLAELLKNYGSASHADNRGRLDRFFAHEFTHTLHKAWTREHPVMSKNSLDEALWDCLVEGLGNYRSLNAKWVHTDGSLTAHARRVLDELEPVFVNRMMSLQTATPATAKVLKADLSMGPFHKKWGALTVALWLAQECAGDDHKLKPWIDAGPGGVLVLAKKYLPEEMSSQLNEAKK